MTRRKVKLAFITKSSARRATFNKRSKGLLKKVDELSTLCGVDACAVIYSPYTEEPLTHPISAPAVRRVLRQFRRKPMAERTFKMVNHREFLRQRVVKSREKLAKLQSNNREKEITRLMLQGLSSLDPGQLLRGLAVPELADLGWVIDRNLRAVKIMLGEA